MNYSKNSFSTTLNYTYTGSMKIPHFAGSINQVIDEVIDSESFDNLSLKLSYTHQIKTNSLNTYIGIKNIFNDYQNDFDIGKNRDSNYIYGPVLPRSLYLGFKYSLN